MRKNWWRNRHNWVEHEQRRAVLADAGGRCSYCGCRLTLKTMTLDHATPVARGGQTEPGNLRAACLSCNNRKAARDEAEFRAELERGRRLKAESRRRPAKGLFA